VAWDEPSPTLVTSPTMPATLLAHPEEMRPLSVEEYLRLQGFPDGWQVSGSTEDKYRQLGNAVPVALGAAVGRHLLDPRPFPAGARTSRYVVESDEDLEAPAEAKSA
jgi:DNA (cytosine-5)-methyltransferase 1